MRVQLAFHVTDVDKGLPCGSKGFVEKLVRRIGKLLALRAVVQSKEK